MLKLKRTLSFVVALALILSFAPMVSVSPAYAEPELDPIGEYVTGITVSNPTDYNFKAAPAPRSTIWSVALSESRYGNVYELYTTEASATVTLNCVYNTAAIDDNLYLKFFYSNEDEVFNFSPGQTRPDLFSYEPAGAPGEIDEAEAIYNSAIDPGVPITGVENNKYIFAVIFAQVGDAPAYTDNIVAYDAIAVLQTILVGIDAGSNGKIVLTGEDCANPGNIAQEIITGADAKRFLYDIQANNPDNKRDSESNDKVQIGVDPNNGYVIDQVFINGTERILSPANIVDGEYYPQGVESSLVALPTGGLNISATFAKPGLDTTNLTAAGGSGTSSAPFVYKSTVANSVDNFKASDLKGLPTSSLLAMYSDSAFTTAITELALAKGTQSVYITASDYDNGGSVYYELQITRSAPSSTVLTPVGGNTSNNNNNNTSTVVGTTVQSGTAIVNGGVASFGFGSTASESLLKGIKDYKDSHTEAGAVIPDATLRVNLPVGTDLSTINEMQVSIPRSLFGGTDQYENGIVIDTDLGKLHLDAAVIAKIASMPGTNDVKLIIRKVDKSKLTKEQQEAIGDGDVYEIILQTGDTNISDIGGQITASLPYKAAEVQDTESITFWYLGANNSLTNIRGAYDAANNEMDFVLSHLSLYAIRYTPKSFDDITDQSFAAAVKFIAAREITLGVDEKTFAPDSNITRADFVLMFMRAYNIAIDESISDNFTDVSADQYYAKALATAKNLGIIKGVGDNNYNPTASISRQDMMTIVYRGLELINSIPANTKKGDFTTYSDSSTVGSYAVDALTAFIGSGAFKADDNLIKPTVEATRADMAVLLYNLLK